MSADEATGSLLAARRLARAALSLETSASTSAERGLRLRAIRKSRSLSLSPSLMRTLQEVGTEVPHPSRASEPLSPVTKAPHVTEASLAWRDVVAKDPADLGPSNDAVETDKETVTYCHQETDDAQKLAARAQRAGRRCPGCARDAAVAEARCSRRWRRDCAPPPRCAGHHRSARYGVGLG